MSRELFPHQIKSVELMLEAESRMEIVTESKISFKSNYGILSNPIGSGKTLTMLTLLNNHPLTLDTCKSVFIRRSGIQLDIKGYLMEPVRDEFLDECRYIPYQLVVCTKPLINEWVNEAETSGIPIHTVSTDTQAKKLETKPPKPHSIIVVHTEQLQLVCKTLSGTMESGHVVFDRVVFDDIHMAKKWKTIRYTTFGLFTWFLSATPGVLTHSNVGVRLRSLCPVLPNDYMLIRTSHLVNVPVITYVEPPVVTKHHLVDTHWMSDSLAGILTHEVKHMLNMGDYDGIRRHFKNILGEEVCKPIHELVLDAEVAELDKLKKAFEKYEEEGMNTTNITNKILSQKRKIDGIRERIDVVNQEEAECPICMCDVERKEMSITPCCFNMFCTECINNEIKVRKACPTCRAPLKKSGLLKVTESGQTISMTHIASMTIKKNSDRSYKTVYEAVEKIMSQDFNKKYIIFTETNDTVKTYKKYLEAVPEIKLASLSGRLSTIKKGIDELREGSLNALFLNSKSSEAGLNLQFVDEIIFIGYCGEDRYNQAIGRVRRYPRTEPVVVHRVTV